MAEKPKSESIPALLYGEKRFREVIERTEALAQQFKGSPTWKMNREIFEALHLRALALSRLDQDQSLSQKTISEPVAENVPTPVLTQEQLAALAAVLLENQLAGKVA